MLFEVSDLPHWLGPIWAGMDGLGEHLVVAAGPRGVMVVEPEAFELVARVAIGDGMLAIDALALGPDRFLVLETPNRPQQNWYGRKRAEEPLPKAISLYARDNAGDFVLVDRVEVETAAERFAR